jgi:hypothetical protein
VIAPGPEHCRLQCYAPAPELAREQYDERQRAFIALVDALLARLG